MTDIAKYRSSEPRITIHNWLRGRDIVEFLGLWEALHNPNFKRIDFEAFKENAGTNAFVFSIKMWNEDLGAIGLLTKSGRYGGGIYAHMDMCIYVVNDEINKRFLRCYRLPNSWYVRCKSNIWQTRET